MGVMAAVAALGAFMAAHAGDAGRSTASPTRIGPSNGLLGSSSEWLLYPLGAGHAQYKGYCRDRGLAAIALRAAQHHTTGNGVTIAGGQRADDPPASS